MAAHTRRDTLWLVWLCLQIPIIVCVDSVDKYPAWLCQDPGAPLHALHRFRTWYLATYNDPLTAWTAVSHPLLSHGGGSWVPLFFTIELFFTLPTVLYAVVRLARARATGTTTTGPLELLLLLYGFETALTTAVCIHNIAYWDPAVYSSAQKNVFRFQLFGPWLVLPALLFADMYTRLLARFRIDTDKKRR